MLALVTSQHGHGAPIEKINTRNQHLGTEFPMILLLTLVVASPTVQTTAHHRAGVGADSQEALTIVETVQTVAVETIFNTHTEPGKRRGDWNTHPTARPALL